MPGCRPGKSHLGQVEADHLPAGHSELAGLGAQAATDVKSPAAPRQPAVVQRRDQLGRGRERCHHR